MFLNGKLSEACFDILLVSIMGKLFGEVIYSSIDYVFISFWHVMSDGCSSCTN